MKLRYSEQKPNRTKRYGLGVTVIDQNVCYYWSHNLKKFVDMNSENRKGSYSSHAPICRTVKAFKRFARKHPEFKGKLRWENRWQEVYA